MTIGPSGFDRDRRVPGAQPGDHAAFGGVGANTHVVGMAGPGDRPQLLEVVVAGARDAEAEAGVERFST